MGYIRGLWEQDGQQMIAFNQAEWLTGEEAAKAMREDGLCASTDHDCQPPNGFYIRNRRQASGVSSLRKGIHYHADSEPRA